MQIGKGKKDAAAVILNDFNKLPVFQIIVKISGGGGGGFAWKHVSG